MNRRGGKIDNGTTSYPNPLSLYFKFYISHAFSTISYAEFHIMSTTIVAQVQGAENAIRYQSSDTDLIWEALQAAGSGVLSIGGRPLMDGNKRLALLGDASLKLALVEDWYGGVEARGTIALLCHKPVY